ncbi:carbohydrate-binding protein [Chitinophaga arvensicola]|uniref:Carbohydrate binding module (Family 6) n=1 Tax=Chitinophaga arvensicola TaxID=29529 RepID=A0A1I0S9N9_9BACT|nr:carbohydrate-binding protein [Chitinophaga arvensicola]SEW52977.1 Carbohydrate binding module (family 6) [Chitinophaga arvensicola]
MINNIKYPLWMLLSYLAVTTVSCKKPDIKGEDITVKQVGVAFKSDGGQLKIPLGDSSYTKTTTTVDIPLKILLSDAAPARFDIGITVNPDTVAGMIASNAIPDGVLLAQEDYSLPNLVNVPFGQQEAAFTLKVNLATFEKYYGQTLAVAVELTNPTKNNQLDPAKKIVVVQINTTSIVPIDQIHYVYYPDAGKSIQVPALRTKNYTLGNGTIQVPLAVSYTSSAGKSFYLRVKPNQDTIAKLLAENALPGVAALTAADLVLPDSIAFKDFNNSLNFPVTVKLAAFAAHAGKKLALALDLYDPSVYKIDTTRNTLIVILDPEGLKYNPYSGTPLQLPAAIGATAMIKAADFDLGGEGWGYHDNDEANRGGTYRTSEGVDIEGNGANIGFTAPGEWLKYTVESQVEGDFDIAINITTPGTTGNVHIEVDGVNQTGSIPYTPTGGWDKYMYIHGTVHFTPGKHLVKFVWEAGDTNLRDFIFTRKN